MGNSSPLLVAIGGIGRLSAGGSLLQRPTPELFEYEESEIFEPSALQKIASDFLEFIVGRSEENEQCPIVCIGCDLGGSILKEALIIAKSTKDARNHRVLTSISTLVFFGTPHRETPTEPWETTLYSIIVHLRQVEQDEMARLLPRAVSTLANEHRRICQRFASMRNQYRILQYTQAPASSNLILQPHLTRLGCASEETVLANVDYNQLTNLGGSAHRDKFLGVLRESMITATPHYRSYVQMLQTCSPYSCRPARQTILFGQTASAVLRQDSSKTWLLSDASEPLVLGVPRAFMNDDFLYSLESCISEVQREYFQTYRVITANVAQSLPSHCKKSTALLCNLIHQAIQHCPLLWQDVEDFFSHDDLLSAFYGQSASLLEPVLWRCFMAVLSAKKPIACVLLAEEAEGGNVTDPFLEHMVSLATTVDCNFKLMILHNDSVTSTYRYPTLVSRLDVANEDIKECVEGDAMSSLDADDPDLKDVRHIILSALPASYSHSLRLISFLRYLEVPRTLGRHQLADGLQLLLGQGELIPFILQHVPESEKRAVRDILLIVTHAFRPLTLTELGVAMAIAGRDDGQMSALFQPLIHENLKYHLASYLTCLVQVDYDAIQLAHPTVRDLLDQNESRANPWHQPRTHPHLGMAILCLQCIGMDFQSDLVLVQNQHDESLSLPSCPISIQPLLKYAVLSWPFHLIQALSDNSDPVDVHDALVLLSDDVITQWLKAWVTLRCPTKPPYHPSLRLSPLKIQADYSLPLDLALRASVHSLDSVAALNMSEDLALLWGVSKVIGAEAGARMWHTEMQQVPRDRHELLDFFGLDPQLAFEVLIAIDQHYVNSHLPCLLSQDIRFGGHSVLRYLLDQHPTPQIPPLRFNNENLVLSSPNSPDLDSPQDFSSLENNVSIGATHLWMVGLAEFLGAAANCLEGLFRVTEAQFAVAAVQAVAASGNFNASSALMSLGLDLDDATPTGSGTSAMGLTSKYGFITILEQLLSNLKEANLNYPDENGATPLHLAAHRGFNRVASTLISHAASITAVDENGATPFLLAVRSGNLSLVRRFLKEVGQQGEFMGTTGSGGYALVPIDKADKNGPTPLISALESGFQGISRLLSQHGAQLHLTNARGYNSIHLAAEAGFSDFLDEILPRNRDLINQRTKRGDEDTALDIAASAGHASCVGALLKSGASGDMATLLRDAARKGQIEIVKLLLGHELTDEAMGEALHYAAMEGKTDICTLLLDAGADKDYRDSSGNTALGLAAFFGERTAVEVLLLRRANLEFKDAVGRTALWDAVRKDSLKIAKLLIDAGADVDAKDNDGMTPFDLAVEREGDLFSLLWKAWLKSLGDNKTPTEWQELLQKAIAQGSVKLAEQLLLGKAEVSPEDLPAAMEAPNVGLVSLLLKHGADPNIMAPGKSERPIHVAASLCDEKLAEVLLDGDHPKGKANVNMKGGSLWSALYACVKGPRDDFKKRAMFKLLVDHGADITDSSGPRGTVLHLASRCSPGLVKHLLQDYSDKLSPDLEDREGRLPAHFAASRGSSMVFDQLLTRTLNRPDHQGRMPIHLAAAGGSLKAMQHIIDTSPLGVKILCEKDNDGWNALHWACRQRDSLVVKWILNVVSENRTLVLNLCTAKERHGWVPLEVAIKHDNKRFIDIFRFTMLILEIGNGVADDIQQPDETWQRAMVDCDSCFCQIYGEHHKCSTWDNFNFCFKCFNYIREVYEEGHEFTIK